MSVSGYISTLRRKLGQELIFVPSVAALIRDSSGRLLYQRKRGSEGWSLPAGAIELGETPEVAVAREVKEETGLVVASSRLEAAFSGDDWRYTYPNGDRVEYAVMVFECTVAQEGAATPLDHETAYLRYFGRDEAPTLALPYPEELLFPSAR